MGAQIENKDYSQYRFTDASKELLQHAVIYYRLKQVDADGAFSYSIVKVIHLNDATVSGITLHVMPNPYVDNVNVKFESASYGKAELRIINASGVVVNKTEANVVNGDNTIQLQNLSSKAPGVYVIAMVIDGKLISNEKIIKQ